MALGADNMQATGLQHGVMPFLPVFTQFLDLFLGGVVTGEGDRRIAGYEQEQAEDQERGEHDDRDRERKASDEKLEHVAPSGGPGCGGGKGVAPPPHGPGSARQDPHVPELRLGGQVGLEHHTLCHAVRNLREEHDHLENGLGDFT